MKGKVVHLRILILACIVLLSSFRLPADVPLPPACASLGTYADLEALGSTGCVDGDKIFSNFTLANSATGLATTPSAADISYALVPPPVGQWGFDFSGFNLSALANATTPLSFGDVTAQYDISIVPGGSQLIDSAEVSLTGSAFDNSAAAISETICVGQTYVGVCTHPVALDTTVGSMNQVFFTPTTLVGVTKDLSVSAFFAGGVGGQAHISAFSNTVDQTGVVPEPSYVALLTVCLGAMLMLAKRLKKTP